MFVQDKDGVLRIAEDVSSATISVSILSLQSVCRAGDLAVNVFTGFDGWPCSCRCHRRRDRIYSSSGMVICPYFMNVIHPVFRAKTWWTRSAEPCYLTLCPAGGGRGPSWNGTWWKVMNGREGVPTWIGRGDPCSTSPLHQAVEWRSPSWSWRRGCQLQLQKCVCLLGLDYMCSKAQLSCLP